MDSIKTFARNVVLETLWPTRCVICDTPGDVLCAACRINLPYLDYYHACPLCGAAFGSIQCSECNGFMLEKRKLNALAFDACASVCVATGSSLQIVKTYKDRNEQRLSSVIAALLLPFIDPSWPHNFVITAIPARKDALRQRGFDHMKSIAQEISVLSRHEYQELLTQKQRKDQRKLSAQNRFSNMRDAFSLKADYIPSSILLLDDVYTTGATLNAASELLKEAGATWVGCLTFLRVM